MRNGMTVFIGSILLASGGFSASAAARATSNTITFALSAPITGDYAEYGNNFKHSVEMAIDEVRGEGGEE